MCNISVEVHPQVFISTEDKVERTLHCLFLWVCQMDDTGSGSLLTTFQMKREVYYQLAYSICLVVSSKYDKIVNVTYWVAVFFSFTSLGLSRTVGIFLPIVSHAFFWKYIHVTVNYNAKSVKRIVHVLYFTNI